VVALSPELVMHAHRMWFASKAAVESASRLAEFKAETYNVKPMSGWFATVFALQVRDSDRGCVCVCERERESCAHRASACRNRSREAVEPVGCD
jgi:uncharacterized protein (DUF488 family)